MFGYREMIFLKVAIPTFMVAGTDGEFETTSVIPIAVFEVFYSQSPGGTD